MVAHQPNRTALDAYVGADTELCEALAGTHDTSNWSKYVSFNLYTCAAVPFSEGGHGSTTENNCLVDIIRVVRTSGASEESSPDGTSSYELSESFSRNEGNSVVGVNAAFSTYNLLDLSGGYHNTAADVYISGWLSLPIANAMVESRAWVAIVGSGAAGNLDVFGSRLWDYDQTIPEFIYEDDLTFSDSYCGSYTYGIAGIGLTASLCLDGSAGITNALSITAASGGIPEFAESTSYGLIEASITPAVAMGMTATASVDLAVIVGGISGNLTIITTSLPATADLAWGLVDGPALLTTYSAGLDLENTLLSGTVSVFVNQYAVSWCSSWGVSYPCGGGWANIVSQPLVSFGGYTYNYELLNYSGSILLEP